MNKTSVMERVITNVFCGGSSSNNNNNVHNTNNINNNSQNSMSITTPEKPHRQQQNKHQHYNNFFHTKMSGGSANSQASNSNQSTPQSMRKYHSNSKPQVTKRFVSVNHPILSIEQLFLDEKFLQHFFFYFTSYERRELAQVCTTWRDILYR